MYDAILSRKKHKIRTFNSKKARPSEGIAVLCTYKLTEVSLEQSCKSLAVAGFVASHLMDGIVNRI